MLKKVISVILTFSLVFSTFMITVGAVTTESYGFIHAYLIESDEDITIEVMTIGDNVYVNARFYETFGFDVKIEDKVAVIGNATNANLPKGAIGFYVDSTDCRRGNSAIMEVHQAPFETIKNENGIWIPFEYSLYMLNGSLLKQADGKLLLSAPKQSILDLLHNISVYQNQYSFDYASDFGYGKGRENTLFALCHFVNIADGFLTFDGYSWMSLLHANPITNTLLGDYGYDTKYGNNVARLVCTNCSEELLDAVDELETANEFLSEDGMLGEVLSDFKSSNEADIGKLLEESQQALENIDEVNNGVSEYNRIYNQLEDAMDEGVFVDFGDTVSDFQKAAGNITTGLQLLSMIAEFTSYYTEFDKRDLYAVNSLEKVVSVLPNLKGDVSFYTKVALLNGVSEFKTDAAMYSLSRFVRENVGDIIDMGIDLCASANIALLAWELISSLIPFISDGLNAADKYELSIYAMCIQNEAHRIYTEKLNEMKSVGTNITKENLQELSQYAYTYLKLCYVTRNAAVGGISTISKEGKLAAEQLSQEQNTINSKIPELLTLAKSAVNDDTFACLGLYDSVIDADCVTITSVSGDIPESTAIAAFEQMLINSDAVWDWNIYDGYDSHQFASMSNSDIIENWIVCTSVPLGVYEVFSDDGIQYTAEPNEANSYADPRGEFWSSYELDADLVDWILENVFGKKPDRSISSEKMYYYGDKVYTMGELGGGPTPVYKVMNYEKMSDGKYEIYVESKYDTSIKEPTYLKFTATPKQDSEYGIYWQIHSYEQTAKPSTSLKPDKTPETSETELFNKYIKESLTLCQEFPSDDIEKEKGVFSALIKDFDNNGIKEMVTFSIYHNVAGQTQIVLNLYTIKGNTVILSDTSEEIFASGAGNFQGEACGFLENNEIKIQRENWNYGGSSHSNNYITFRISGDKLVLVNNYSLYEFYRYDTYEYKENVSGEIFSTSEEYYSAIKTAGYDSEAHKHVGYVDSEFDVKIDDYKMAECFKGNHIFTLFESQEMLVSGEYAFVHDNTNLEEIIS